MKLSLHLPHFPVAAAGVDRVIFLGENVIFPGCPSQSEDTEGWGVRESGGPQPCSTGSAQPDGFANFTKMVCCKSCC